MKPRTFKLPKILPDLDDTFIHSWGSTLVDTGHPDHRELVESSLGNHTVDTILLTSQDAHSVGNIGLFPHAKVFGFPVDGNVHIEHQTEPGMGDLLDCVFPEIEVGIEPLNEGETIDIVHAKLDVIAFPVPDRSGVMFHDPEQKITFVGAMPAGRLPTWSASAEDYAIACQRLDCVDLGDVYSRVDPPSQDGDWFKKRIQRFAEHFGTTLGEKRSSSELIKFLETDFGGRPKNDLLWACAVLRYQSFF